MVVDLGYKVDPETTTVHLFNGPFVTWGDYRVSVPEGSKRLLALVALRHGRVERQYAAGVLWSGSNERRAAGNLRSALWRLRGSGIDILEADKWSLELRPGVAVDVLTTLDWADRLIANTARPDDLTVLSNRLDGLDLLPGWYDDWAIIERERIRQRMLHAFEALSRMLVSVGRCAEAVDVAMLVVNAEPLRESAQRVLVEAHAAEGNWCEVQRAFAAYRNLVRRELGIEPSPEFARWAQASGAGLPTPTVPHPRGADVIVT